ncbi:hypothetical protein CKO28_25090 [Rhodovibrio sodomensis]|uniref:Transcription factor zinc-finger domain-containing protein n=1 Tax=Rhodovibrio sodomensis TaxID=1088 RepID=A0ABS1DL72_9PROT|nr:zf-TFIIB domain-containing protein [Rhodovibrio sodomensis]MBK1671280.1 hypothetical protein [Rhodovibrio sodomensis]
MKCPIDGETLQIAKRKGVEIDYCPTCRGVWLDRGELDKIIERSAPVTDDQDRQGQRGNAGYSQSGSSRPKKKESFLSELFDF